MKEIKFNNSISSIDKENWNKLVPDNDYPFLKYEFLELLEKTNCVGKNTGWHPAHISICLLYTSPSPRDIPLSRMPSSA